MPNASRSIRRNSFDITSRPSVLEPERKQTASGTGLACCNAANSFLEALMTKHYWSAAVMTGLTLAFVGGDSAAQVGTASARGNGKLQAFHCSAFSPPLLTCLLSGSGTDYHFDFTGPLDSKKGILGTVAIRDSDLGVRVLSLQVVGFIDPNTNLLQWVGTCEVVHDSFPGIVDIATCNGMAIDSGEPGSNDLGQFFYSSPTIGIGSGFGQFSSGGAQVD